MGSANGGSEEDPLASLLVRLPVLSRAEVESTLTGLLIVSPGDIVRLVVADRIFEFTRADIVSARSLEGDDVVVGTVELVLREGSTVRGIYPARPFRELLRGRRPFALSSRVGPAPRSTSSDRYDELARNYLTMRGLRTE